MIKFVLQAIPSYVMSIFRLPNTLLDEIEKMMNAFWWGHGGTSNRGLRWLSWEKLSVHKNHGGMGFKDLAAFNVAMLGKQGWQLQTNIESLVSRIFKVRYYPTSNYLDAKLGHNPSFVWRSIHSAKMVVRQGARWKIGTGFNIPIVNAPWIGSGSSIPPVGEDILNLQSYTVGHLIDQEVKVWNEQLVWHLFVDETAQQILNTLLHQQVQSDKMIWKAEKNGRYSVKSAYRICVEEVINNEHLQKPGYWSGIWKLKVPPKVKNLVWRICRYCFPTRVKLRNRGINCPSECVFCADPHEDSYHILFHFQMVVDTWHAANIWHEISPLLSQFDNAPDIIFNLLEKLPSVQIERIVTIMWSIWKARNLKLWQHVSDSTVTILERAKHLLEGWRAANRKQLITSQEVVPAPPNCLSS